MSDNKPRDAKLPHPKPKGERVEIPLHTTRANAIVEDETYDALRAENRVVMRHNIALNLENFAAATDQFERRSTHDYPDLKPVRPPFFSVLIPNYNGRAHLQTLFDALSAQTFTDFEVILGDDASSDDSVVFAESYAGHMAVRVMLNRQNRGFVATVNAAAAAAHGRILVLLNNDTEPEATWLAEVAKQMCIHPDAAIVASKILLFDQRDHLHTAGDTLGVDGIPHNRGVWELDRGQYDAAVEIFGGCGGAMAIRKEVWQALGGFDEEFWMYLEDVDFSFRARLGGWKVVFAPAARVYHKLSSSGGDTLSSFYVGRNTLWVIAKNMPTSLLWRHLPHIFAAQASIALDALRNIRGKAARQRLAGQWAGLLGLPRQLRKRRTIQQRRWVGDDKVAALLTK